jgi:DNA-directed RNA polymerase subunit L
MVKVSHIKVTEFNLINEINNKKNVDLQKCLALISKTEAQTLLTKKSKITVSFELENTNSDIANGIRRCLIDEVEVKSFDFDEYKDFVSSDPYILSDFIKKQVCLLPIDQEFNYIGVTIKLEKTNNNDEIIDVLSDDFVISGTGSQNDLEKIIGKNIVLCRLRPGETITINNIVISSGLAYKDAGKFSLISNITYEILDVDPIVETKQGQTGKSSLVSNPTHFLIKYTTHRNTEHPLKLMVKCCDTLIVRLNAIHTDMLNIKNADTSYFSNLLTLETTGNLHKIQIRDEYWTLINLICRYCYILTDSNIKFISPSLIHPEKHIGVINITHPEFSTLIQKSIKKIITELEIIKSAF